MKQSLHYLLMASHLSLQKKFFKSLKGTDLTIGQPKIIDYLGEHDGAGQKDIASGCQIEASSLTSVLNGMEEKGLIVRKNIDGDRRSYHIFLTEKGQRYREIIDRNFSEIESSAMRGISEEEKTAFLNTLFKIYGNLK